MPPQNVDRGRMITDDHSRGGCLVTVPSCLNPPPRRVSHAAGSGDTSQGFPDWHEWDTPGEPESQVCGCPRWSDLARLSPTAGERSVMHSAASERCALPS